MVVSVGRTAAFSCCGRRSPAAFESMMVGRVASTQRAVISAAISAGLKPLSTLWLANNSLTSSCTSSSSSSSSLSSSRRVLSSGGLFNLGRAYCADGGGWGSSSSSSSWRREGGGWQNGGTTASQLAAYDQYGNEGQQQQPPPQQQELPRPPLIVWEKDLANAVQLIGRIGREIELKYLHSGKVVATTSLAVHSSKRTEDPSWFELEMWDALAEIAAHHVKKGESIFVTGRILLKKYVKNDVEYTIAKVAVRDLCFVEPHSDQSPTYGQPKVSQEEDYVLMGSSNRPQDVTNMDSPQRNWNQQQLTSQPSQGTAVPKGQSNSYEDPALATEKRWQEYFADPTQWWDNRERKKNPKAPDFKHKSTQEALWITSWNNPPWVAQQLAVLEEKRAQHSGGFGESRHRSKENKLSSFKDSDFLH